MRDTSGTFFYCSLCVQQMRHFSIANVDYILLLYFNYIVLDYVDFVPRGLKTGLAMRTGDSIIYLDRIDPVVEFDLDPNTETTITGKKLKILLILHLFKIPNKY